MKTSRLPHLLGGVCLSAAIMLPLSSPANAADMSYSFLELSPQRLVLDLTDVSGTRYNDIGLGVSLAGEISDSTYLRFDGYFFDVQAIDSAWRYYRASVGGHQSITSAVDFYQEVGLKTETIESGTFENRVTGFTLALGLRARPVRLVELEAQVAYEKSYMLAARFLGEKELEGASMGLSLMATDGGVGDSGIASIDFRFNF